MRRIAATIALAAAAMAVTAGATAGNGSYVVHFSPLNIVDTGKKGLTAGDLIVSHDRLYQNGKNVGRSALTCTITDASVPEAACSVTWALPGGNISGQFLNSPPARKIVSITGGTGRYVGARGQAVLVESGRRQTGTLTFSLMG